MLQYFSGQGRALIAPRLVTGLPGPLIWQGDASALEMTMEEEVFERKENYTGQRGLALRRTKELKMNLSVTFAQMSNEVGALLTRGEIVTQAVTPVVGEVIAATLPELGAYLMLGAFDVGSVTIKDSTATPKTLTAGTNYLLNAKAGTIEIVDLTTGGPFVAPLTADYTPAAASAIKMLSAAETEYWFRFQGVNTAATGSPAVVADWYRVRFSPTSGFGFIQEESGEFPAEGAALVDDTKAASSDFGQFGRLFLA